MASRAAQGQNFELTAGKRRLGRRDGASENLEDHVRKLGLEDVRAVVEEPEVDGGGIALGIDLVETDPRPTADGALVNVHDTTVDRTTDGKGVVDQMTLAQVQALHVKSAGLAGDFSCEKIPTLRELLQTCVGRAVVLVDANKTDRVDLLVQAIEDAHAVDWAVFDTSSMDKIDRALVLEPNHLPVFVGGEGVLGSSFGSSGGGEAPASVSSGGALGVDVPHAAPRRKRRNSQRRTEVYDGRR